MSPTPGLRELTGGVTLTPMEAEIANHSRPQMSEASVMMPWTALGSSDALISAVVHGSWRTSRGKRAIRGDRVCQPAVVTD